MKKPLKTAQFTNFQEKVWPKHPGGQILQQIWDEIREAKENFKKISCIGITHAEERFIHEYFMQTGEKIQSLYLKDLHQVMGIKIEITETPFIGYAKEFKIYEV